MYRAIFTGTAVLNAASKAELQTITNTGYPAPYAKYGLAVYIYNSTALNAAWHSGSWLHLCAVGLDLDEGNVAAVAINETEGLSTSVDYSGLMFAMLRKMKDQDLVSVAEVDAAAPALSYLGENRFAFNRSIQQLEVYSVLGNSVLKNTDTKGFDLSGQAAGIYLVKADGHVQKVIVR